MGAAATAGISMTPPPLPLLLAHHRVFRATGCTTSTAGNERCFHYVVSMFYTALLLLLGWRRRAAADGGEHSLGSCLADLQVQLGNYLIANMLVFQFAEARTVDILFSYRTAFLGCSQRTADSSGHPTGLDRSGCH